MKTLTRLVLVSAFAGAFAGVRAECPSAACPTPAAPAPYEKVAAIQLAGEDVAVAAGMKVAGIAGLNMLTAQLAEAIHGAAIYKYFGPGRENMPFAIFVYNKPDSANLDNAAAAIVYPIESKEAFLEKHPGIAEKDGLFEDKASSSALFPFASCMRFSPDGKWVAGSDRRELLEMAVTSAGSVQPLGRGTLRVARVWAGDKLIRCLMNSLEESGQTGLHGPLVDSLESFRADVVVGDSGITVVSSMAIKEGSAGIPDAAYAKPLAPDTLSKVSGSAVGAACYAEDAGGAWIRLFIEKALESLRGKGISLDSLGIVSTPACTSLNIDLEALIKYLKEGGLAKAGRLEDDGKFCEEFAKLISAKPDGSNMFEGPAWREEVSIKGYTPRNAIAARFAATLPEAAGKPVALANFGSLYTYLLAAAPAVLKSVPEEFSQIVSPALASLPEPGPGGIASAQWREGRSLRGVMRVSADEIRGIGAACNAGMSAFYAITMQQMQMRPPDSFDDDAADDDDDVGCCGDDDAGDDDDDAGDDDEN